MVVNLVQRFRFQFLDLLPLTIRFVAGGDGTNEQVSPLG
jgi:hypothetical protein